MTTQALNDFGNALQCGSALMEGLNAALAGKVGATHGEFSKRIPS